MASSSAALNESDERQNSASSTSTIVTVLQPDIIRTHILSRLDASTLAVASSVSSDLRRLCNDEDLWRKLCIATWSSLVDPIASRVISTFPGGHRSFFSDAFPSLSHAAHHPHREYPDPLPELIFAVDIHCEGKPLFSRVKRVDTQSDTFLGSELLVNILEPNELVPTPVKFNEELLPPYLQENLRLSWIVIDPTRKRAANLSSSKPFLVDLDWDVREMGVVSAVMVYDGEKQGPEGPWEERLRTKATTEQDSRLVRCVVTVTGVNVGGELHFNDVSMFMMEDDESPLFGRIAVMILQCAMENGERKKVAKTKGKFETTIDNMWFPL